MAVALDKEEVKVFLPWDVIEAGKGISMDIGKSLHIQNSFAYTLL